MNDTMIFCTCAETNKEIYLNRVKHWYEQLKDVDADLYCFVDGVIPIKDILAKGLGEINFVCLRPVLGRYSIWVFPGWKRSFVEALKVGRAYNNVVHIEADVKLLSKDKIVSYFNKKGYYCGTCITYGNIETALMILNDENNNEELIERYSEYKQANFQEDINFEKMMQKSFLWNIVFNGDRFEGKEERKNPEYDFYAQYF